MRQTHGNVNTRRRVIRFSLLILFLMLALARTNDAAEIQRMFTEY